MSHRTHYIITPVEDTELPGEVEWVSVRVNFSFFGNLTV